jgi:NAD(P)-dependent dehydrogenase (short-subunit alcohol dehydrogenase family)
MIKYNVTVNLIRPGIVLTPMSETWFQAKLQKYADTPAKLLGPSMRSIPVHEICKAVRFLIESELVTAHCLTVDGGSSIHTGI